jgi:Rieske Fe-S protein
VLQLATGQVIVLVEVEQPQARRPNTAAIHHAFLLTMEQFGEAQTRLAAAGYEIADARAAFRARGEYSFDVADPDDHRWQIQAFGPEQHELLKPDVGVVDCGPAEQFAVGSVTVFRAGNFFLVREKAGFLALSRWCRHANGLTAYQPQHWQFFCAFHGATYNLQGDHTGHLPGVAPLRQNPVTITPDGRVLVDTDLVIERAADEPPMITPIPATVGGHVPA